MQDEPIEQSISKDQEFINEDQQKKIIASREKEKFLTKKVTATIFYHYCLFLDLICVNFFVFN